MRSLDDHVCFSTYVASRSIQRLYQPLLKEHNLTYPQYLVLIILFEKQHLTVNEIGVYLDLGSGTLTPLLKRMEAAELIQRVRRVSDERIVDITLTQKGVETRKLMSKLPDVLTESSDLSDDEWATLTVLMNKLIKSIS
ncbi:MarR family transcriptional regulator [Weissella muntiaci]|uniref:MarR family transcriptional regulator n=2 Tax=Weissella muntiaci TaxID=2508881 RepID=A0A6C2C511_9LACO|nr:MarR family transcriptional regulator [Weissella muntiaci]